MRILPVLGSQKGVEEYWNEMQKYDIEVDKKNPHATRISVFMA